MAVDRAPYINYNELNSMPLTNGEGAEIPIFIGPTSNNVSSISRTNIVACKNIGEVEDIIGNTGNLYHNIKAFFKENNARIINGEVNVAVPYIYVFDLGSNSTIDDFRKALKESKVKRDATCITIVGDTSTTTATALKWTELTVDSTNVTETMDANGSPLEESTTSSVTKLYELDNYGDIKFSPLYLATLPGATKSVIDSVLGGAKVTANQKKAFDNAYTGNNTNLQITFANVIKNELKDEAKHGLLRIAYMGVEKQTTSETFEQYVQRIANLTSATSYPRIGFVEMYNMDDLGLTTARICSTEYYIEPGYAEYLSVERTSYTHFPERTPEERDALFNAGLIFNEYDYTLPEITPRICLAVSSAWGVTEPADMDDRVNDALIHTRRNVDRQIRELFKVIAPQLKRNETSVNLLQLRTELNICLEGEVDLGRIQEYNIEVEEVTYNPYCLKISGTIIPVNSTLAIEFENYVGAPYAIATDYI